MSWGEIKKVNSNLNKPLNELIEEKHEDTVASIDSIRDLVTTEHDQTDALIQSLQLSVDEFDNEGLLVAMNANTVKIINTINAATGGYQLFTSNGSFTVPEEVTTLTVTAISGGGGGGAGGGCSASGYYMYWQEINGVNTAMVDLGQAKGASGGGGGYGNYVKDKALTVTPGQTLQITVGGAGTAGATNGTGAGSAGGTGGSTIIGSLLTLTGGTGGGGGGASSNNVSGAAGAAGVTGGKAGVAGYGYYGGNWNGSSDWPGTVNAGGAAGKQTAVFKGAYGNGGTGGNGGKAVTCSDSVRSVSSTGTGGTAGTKGAVLICWGQWTHDQVYT